MKYIAKITNMVTGAKYTGDFSSLGKRIKYVDRMKKKKAIGLPVRFIKTSELPDNLISRVTSTKIVEEKSLNENGEEVIINVEYSRVKSDLKIILSEFDEKEEVIVKDRFVKKLRKKLKDLNLTKKEIDFILRS